MCVWALGWGGATPIRVLEISAIELSGEKPAESSRRVVAIYFPFLDPRSIFDPIMIGQKSIIAESTIFQLFMRKSQKLYGEGT